MRIFAQASRYFFPADQAPFRLVLFGPVLGGLMVVFLPLIGLVMLFGFTGAKLVAMCRKALGAFAAESRA